MAKKIHHSHKKHKSSHTKPAHVKMSGHGPGSNLKLGTPSQTIHLKPSRRQVEMEAGTSEEPDGSNEFDPGKT